MNRTIEIQILERQICDADQRLAELEVVQRTVAPTSYRGQELGSERIDLRRIRDIAAIKLRDLRARPLTDKRRDEQMARAIEERRETTLAWIEKLEAAGDHRQARIWRLAMLDIPMQVAKEF